ncbi:MAG: hypothetical protein Q8909_09810 [Bacteroidota bacterium]|nr:hypothetical protein [Bacteroidota bacterium]
MKTLEDLKQQLQNASDIEDAIAIRIRMIELKREFKKHTHSISPITDLIERIHQDKRLSFR